MKRIFYLIIAIIIILPFAWNKEGINRTDIEPLPESNESLDLVWNEEKYTGTLKPYSAKQDFSNISNAQAFTNMNILDKYAITKNQFIIKKTEAVYEQPFSIYENNVEEGIPNFITSDSLLHVYHLMCDYIIRNMERERLVDELKIFTEGMFKKSMEIYYGTRDASVKKAALKSIAYFGIAMRLQDINLPGGIPLEASRIIDNDVKKVRSRWPSGTSEIFPYNIDYKMYITRGHYSRETEFRNYFITVMWYGSTPMIFETLDNSLGIYKRMDEQIAMAVITTSAILGDENLSRLWEDIYKVTSVCFGKTEDVTLYDMSDIIKVIYGEKIDFNKLWDDDKIQKVYELAKQRYNLHLGETLSGKINSTKKGFSAQTQFRLMAQIYGLDTDVYNNLIIFKDHQAEQGGRFPKGLDIPSAFGSDKAYTVTMEQISADKDKSEFSDNIERLRSVLNLSGEKYPAEYSLNNSIFWILKDSILPEEQGKPSFMVNDNWSSKNLITYLGAVSDSRHPTYLVAKPNEEQNAKKVPPADMEMPGYVEPKVDIYSRLEYMGKYMKGFLSENNFTDSGAYKALGNFIDLSEFLKDISIKELSNKTLTQEEEARLRNYGKEIKMLTLNMVEGEGNTKQWEQVPKVDRNMAAVSDGYIHENQILQTSVGFPDYIYVVVPYKGKLYITRGSVYSYYEFVEPVSKKLDDSHFQDYLKNGKEPLQEEWIQKIRLD